MGKLCTLATETDRERDRETERERCVRERLLETIQVIYLVGKSLLYHSDNLLSR